jgi:hypothetical protein
LSPPSAASAIPATSRTRTARTCPCACRSTRRRSPCSGNNAEQDWLILRGRVGPRIAEFQNYWKCWNHLIRTDSPPQVLGDSQVICITLGLFWLC